jgi:hypothetical protein
MNMKSKFIFLTFVAVLLFSTCGSGQRLEIVPSVPAKTVKTKIDSVDIFVDCSGSMKGYVAFSDKDAETPQKFKNIVPLLTNNLLHQIGIGKVSVYKVTDGAETKEPSITGFFTHLTTGKIFGGATTELDKIIINMIENQKKSNNKLSILVTDGVLSFGPSNLKNDRMYNIKNKAILKSNTHNALLKDTTLSISLVKYLSDFNGDYYYTCKEQVEYRGKVLANRPFYFLIVGKKELVSEFLSRENLLPQSEGVFTVTNSVELEVALFKKKLEKQKGKVNSLLKVETKKGITAGNTSYEKDKDKVFIVGVKIANVSKACYTNESAFFSIPKSDDKNVKIEKLNDASAVDGVDEGAQNPNRVQDYDYFYKVTIDKKMFDNEVNNKTLTFYFDPSLDIVASHTDKDYDLKNVAELERKTWGLNLITDAIEAANAGKKPQGAKFTLTLNKIKN